MKFFLIVEPDISEDLAEIFEYIAKQNPAAASRVVSELRSKVRSLATMPKRCAIAPENATLKGNEIRHLIHGNYRIIFDIEKTTVRVLEIRHSARLPSTSS